MRRQPLSIGTRLEIDEQVTKVLRGLGDPEPPLDLDAAFSLLKLDPQYYKLSNDGPLSETISRVKVGTKLIIQNPMRLWDAIKNWDLKALYVPEQRRIFVDDSLHEKKKRWSSAHELVHSILEWHEDYTWGDTGQTLNKECHEQIEAEANYGAGRLLFMQSAFEKRLHSIRLSLANLNTLAKEFNNSWTSCVYRAVENCMHPAFAVIGAHPQRGGGEIFRYFVESPDFERKYAAFSQAQALKVFRSYCTFKRRGPLGQCEFPLLDDNGESNTFHIESFGLPQGDVLSLGQWIRKSPFSIVVP